MIRRTVMGGTPLPNCLHQEPTPLDRACHAELDAKPLIYLDKNYGKLLINLTNESRTHPLLGGFGPVFGGLH
jgi:hypothetical protein